MNRNIGMLFDLDGVLIDSEHEYGKIWKQISEMFPTEFEDLPTRIKGMTLTNILNTYFPGKETEVTNALHLLESKMTYRWLPGAREFIEWLNAEKIPIALVTSSDNYKMKHLKHDLPELMPMFNDIVTANRISRSKPDPEGYLLGASLIGCNIRKCAIFEDSLQGVKAGMASGAYVVGIAGTLPASIITPFCNNVVNSFSDINKESLINNLISRN